MASTFDGFLSDADAAVLDTFGDSITYTPTGGSPKSITAVVGDIETEGADDDIGRFEQSFCDILILLDATDGIASPAKNDVVTVGSDDFKVEQIVGKNATVARLRLRRDTDQRRHSDQQYKRV